MSDRLVLVFPVGAKELRSSLESLFSLPYLTFTVVYVTSAKTYIYPFFLWNSNMILHTYI